MEVDSLVAQEVGRLTLSIAVANETIKQLQAENAELKKSVPDSSGSNQASA